MCYGTCPMPSSKLTAVEKPTQEVLAGLSLPSAISHDASSRQAAENPSQSLGAQHGEFSQQQQLDWREQLQNSLLAGHVSMVPMHMQYGGVSMAYPMLPMARMQYPHDPRLFAFLPQHLPQPSQAMAAQGRLHRGPLRAQPAVFA